MNILSIESAILAMLSLAVVFVGKNYLLPFLSIEKNRRYARWIAHLADEITDDLMARYPNNKWVKFIDESVDKLMEICGIDKEVAKRAVNSALKRKIKVARG